MPPAPPPAVRAPKPSRLRPLPALALLLAGAAQADTPVATAQLPTVTTELRRDGSVLPYGRINELLARFDAHGEGLFRMEFRVDTRKTRLPLSGIRLAVRSDDADHAVPLDADGRFTLPVLPATEAKTADLATNVPKGQMAIRGSIELTTPPEQLDLARVRQVMRVAARLRDELLPWYLRWLFPRVEGVRVCADTPTWELHWREQGRLVGVTLPPAAGEREPEPGAAGAARPCTLLTGQENWPEAARLIAPPGTRLSLKLQGR